MTEQQLSELRARTASRVRRIQVLLGEYRATGDRELADFVESYSRSLELDFELAAAEGQVQQLALIAQDVHVLLQDTLERVVSERVRGAGGKPLLS